MPVDPRRIAVLGAGTIGEALISGLLTSGWRSRDEIVATCRSTERATELRDRHGIDVTSNPEAVAGSRVVVIAVKPQDFETLLGDGVPVARAMPNTAATVQEGIAGVCAGAHASDDDLGLAEDVLAHLGAVVRLPER